MAAECLEDRAGVDAEPARRKATWHSCLHEAAHLVSARVLLGKGGTAMVFGDGGGAALVGGGVPTSFKEAMVAAAGIIGDVLVLLYPVPEGVATMTAEVADPVASQRVRAGMGTVMTDREALARWCILHREAEPQAWAARHEHVLSSAQEFVLEHRHEVLEVATALFRRGIVTLPAEPEKGVVNVS